MTMPAFSIGIAARTTQPANSSTPAATSSAGTTGTNGSRSDSGKGLGVAFGTPRYVVEIRPETQQVVIGTFDELGRDSLEADRTNWLIGDVPTEFRCAAQIRYHHTSAPCEVRVLSEDRFRVQFEGAAARRGAGTGGRFVRRRPRAGRRLDLLRHNAELVPLKTAPAP